MRFSAVFEPEIVPISIVQTEERARTAQVSSVQGSEAPKQEPPDDLDQRVRQIGEWQLEDW